MLGLNSKCEQHTYLRFEIYKLRAAIKITFDFNAKRTFKFEGEEAISITNKKLRQSLHNPNKPNLEKYIHTIIKLSKIEDASTA